MRIYKSDGSYIDNPQDTAFGWNFSDIHIDEANPNYQTINRRLRNLEDSIDDSFTLIDPPIVHINTAVKIQRVESVVEAQLQPEGLVPEENAPKLANIDVEVPSKTRLANLINPCSVESKMLLSVIHYAKYKMLIKDKDIINLGDLKNSGKIKFLISKSQDIASHLRNEIDNYHEDKEKNMMSLMMELILNDSKCDLDDITNGGGPNIESSDLGNSLPSDGSDSELKTSPSRLELSRQSDVLDSFGFSEIFDRSIEKICEETYDIRMKIDEIRKSFQEDEVRVNSLIEETRAFEKHLRETKFLEDLLHLLNGNLDKVKVKKSAFSIFIPPDDLGERNLIV